MHIDGQCHCGYVRYEADVDPTQVSICHCTDCQLLTGSAYRVTVAATRDRFTVRGNAPKAYAKVGDSGAVSVQYFCPKCGSPIYRASGDANDARIGIRIGTIRQRRQLTPSRQFWLRSALPFIHDLRALPGKDGD